MRCARASARTSAPFCRYSMLTATEASSAAPSPAPPVMNRIDGMRARRKKAREKTWKATCATASCARPTPSMSCAPIATARTPYSATNISTARRRTGRTRCSAEPLLDRTGETELAVARSARQLFRRGARRRRVRGQRRDTLVLRPMARDAADLPVYQADVRRQLRRRPIAVRLEARDRIVVDAHGMIARRTAHAGKVTFMPLMAGDARRGGGIEGRRGRVRLCFGSDNEIAEPSREAFRSRGVRDCEQQRQHH